MKVYREAEFTSLIMGLLDTDLNLHPLIERVHYSLGSYLNHARPQEELTLLEHRAHDTPEVRLTFTSRELTQRSSTIMERGYLSS